MRLRNTNPLGDVELPLIGRVIAAGEEFEVPDDIGAALLEQTGNYEAVAAKPAKAVAAKPAGSAKGGDPA